MSRIFGQLIQQSRRVSKDEYASNFGRIAEDVIDMITSPQAVQATREAREIMESAGTLGNGIPRLQSMEYGLFSNSLELEQGLVAAVDGRPVLPIQKFTAGQAISVGIGSLSHTRPLMESMHYWSSKVLLYNTDTTDQFIIEQERGLFGISQTAYMRYFEVLHGLEISEPYVFFDGPLVYEWLTATREGVNLYERLFSSQKSVMGIIKSLKANVNFATFSRALKSKEVYIIETLADHLENLSSVNRNQGETSERYVMPEFLNNIAPYILRGIFKPNHKTFGFEVHIDQFSDMMRIMASDCQLNNIGHEIPYLLNRVDEEIKRNFNSTILKERIASSLVVQSEELFFEESDERNLR